MFVCVSNKSGRQELIVGNKYELFKHENHPKVVWVKIPDNCSAVGWKTIQCYLEDFVTKSQWRNDLIDKLLD